MTVGQCTVPSWEQIRCLPAQSIWIDGQTPSSLEGPFRNSCGGYSRRRRALPTSTFVLMKEPQPQGGMERLRLMGRHSYPKASCALNLVRINNPKPRPTPTTKTSRKNNRKVRRNIRLCDSKKLGGCCKLDKRTTARRSVCISRGLRRASSRRLASINTGCPLLA